MPNTPWPIIWLMPVMLLILITSHMTPSQWVIPYPSLLMADPSEKPSESIYHSYWLIIYSISTCTLVYLLIDSSLADKHSIVLPIVPLSSYWTIAIIYLQSHSHISTYISTCTYARDGQLLSWSNLLANSESHQTLTLPSSTILISSVTFIICFASESETEDQSQPSTLCQVSHWHWSQILLISQKCEQALQLMLHSHIDPSYRVWLPVELG
jgi:hypothetical protein